MAPVLILTVAKETNAKNAPNYTYQYDTGQSVAHLTFQAMHEELFVHQMSGFDKAKARKLFSLVNDYKPLTVFAIGYIDNYHKLTQSLQKMELSERKRNDFNEFVFEEKFGNKS